VYVKTFHGGKPWPLHPALVQERFVDIEAAYGDIYAAQRAELKAALEQPAPVQEPVAFFDPQGKGFYWAKPTKITAPVTVDVKPLPLYTTPPAAPVQERNFCERCGKRLGSGIHTCTPPEAEKK
jgi:hypothetical protein